MMLDINRLIEKLDFADDVSEFINTITMDETEYKKYKNCFM